MDQVTQTEEVTTVQTTPAAEVVQKTTTIVPPTVRTEHPQRVYDKKRAIFRMYQIVWYILGLIEVLLGFRMALLAMGANPASGFTSLIYALSNPFALPFSGILPAAVSGSSIFEWSTIIAAIVYAVIAYGIVYLFQIVKPVSQQEVVTSVDNP